MKLKIYHDLALLINRKYLMLKLDGVLIVLKP